LTPHFGRRRRVALERAAVALGEDWDPPRSGTVHLPRTSSAQVIAAPEVGLGLREMADREISGSSADVVPWRSVVLLPLAYLGAANAFALLRLLPKSDREKNAEILALRHRLAVLQRQLGPDRVRFTPSDVACSRRCCTVCPRACCGTCAWSFARTPNSDGDSPADQPTIPPPLPAVDCGTTL